MSPVLRCQQSAMAGSVMTDELDPLLDGPPSRLTISHRSDRPTAISLAITVALIVGLIVYLFERSDDTVALAEEAVEQAQQERDAIRAQLVADQRVTDCLRKLSGAVSTAERRADVAETDLVVALGAGGSRGGIDMDVIFAEIDAANEVYKQADAAYSRAVTEGVDVERDCPGV